MLELSTLFILAALVWLWFDSMRARERALALGKRACERDGLMFLDETVECVALRFARNDAGHMALRRTYGFEFSDTGNNRRSGSIVMLGGEVESLYTNGPAGGGGATRSVREVVAIASTCIPRALVPCTVRIEVA